MTAQEYAEAILRESTCTHEPYDWGTAPDEEKGA